MIKGAKCGLEIWSSLIQILLILRPAFAGGPEVRRVDQDGIVYCMRPKTLKQQMILPECACSFDTLNDTSSAVAWRWSSQKSDSMSRLGSWSSTRWRSISVWRNGMTGNSQRWHYYFVTVEYSSTLCIRINISKNLNIILWKLCFGQICFFFK